MTDAELIDIIKDHFGLPVGDGTYECGDLDMLELCRHVAEAQREADAKVAEEFIVFAPEIKGDTGDVTAHDIAAAIRKGVRP